MQLRAVCAVVCLAFATLLSSQTAPGSSGTRSDEADVVRQKLLIRSYLLSKDFSLEERGVYLGYASRATRLGFEDDLRRLWSEELFQVTLQVAPSGTRMAMQEAAVITLAPLDPERALELLTAADPLTSIPPGTMPEDVRVDACSTLFPELWKRKGMASLAAIRTVAQRIGETGEYPYSAVQAIVEDLAKLNSEEALSLISEAFSFYRRGSKVLSADGHFVDFLIASHKLMPSAITREAILFTASELSEKAAKGSPSKYRSQVHTERGVAEFDNPADRVLFELVPTIREVDPALAERLVRDRPALGLASKVDGPMDVGEGVLLRGSAAGSDDSRLLRRGLAESRLQRIRQMAPAKPDEALRLALDLNDPDLRSTALGYVAAGFAPKDVQRAQAILRQARSARDSVHDPPARLHSIVADAMAAAALRNVADLRRSVKEGLELGTEVFQEDQDAHPTKPAINTAGFHDLRELARISARIDPEGTVAQVTAMENHLLQAYLLLSVAEGLREAGAHAAQ